MNNQEKYPRQFLVSTTKAPTLEKCWGVKTFANYNVYHSPLLQFHSAEDSSKNNFALMFGYAYNSDFNNENEVNILANLLEYENPSNYSAKIK